MGIALANECARRGAEVDLVCGPISLPAAIVSNPRIHRTDVESAEEMYQAAKSKFSTSDVGILCAAVADFTPSAECKADVKIKRAGDDMVIRLCPTRDIAKALGSEKRDDQVLVGFALETNDEQNNAKDKLRRKNFDFIVLNSLNDKGAGFKHDTNKITIISEQESVNYDLKSKDEVAKDILDYLKNKCL